MTGEKRRCCDHWYGWEIPGEMFRRFPTAQKLIGDELQLIQFGGMPKDAKPFRGVGSGVIEIALRYTGDAYRAVVAVQLGKKIFAPRLSEEIEERHRNAKTGC